MFSSDLFDATKFSPSASDYSAETKIFSFPHFGENLFSFSAKMWEIDQN
jgi:hypothetical protein